jgi:hypothetical protein
MATVCPEGLWKPPNLKTHKGLTLEDIQKKPENDLKMAWPPLMWNTEAVQNATHDRRSGHLFE